MELSISKIVLIRPQEGTSAFLTFFLVLPKILACKKWEQAINKGDKFFDLIMDLSKASVTIFLFFQIVIFF